MIRIKGPFSINKKYVEISIYILVVVILAIASGKIINNPSIFFKSVSTFFATASKVIAPFLYGFGIAFLLNPLVMFVENKAIGKISIFKNNFKARRTVSNIITYIFVIGCICWLVAFFIPQMAENTKNFFITLPNNVKSLINEANLFFDNIDYINSEDVVTLLNLIFKPIVDATADLPLMAQTIINGTFLAASTMFNLILGIFISFYMLTDKEGFIREAKKIFYAFGEEKRIDKLLSNFSRVNAIFKGFIVGKAIDSLIIGILCYIGLKVLGMPLPLMISVIVGITNMIPYFGPFIGAIPAILIVLLIEPIKAVWIALFILVLQQLDGNYIGPKILGISTGMGPIWIIFSVTVGGAIAGPLGMLLGVPICASIRLFFNDYVNHSYEQKYFYESPTSSADSFEDEK